MKTKLQDEDEKNDLEIIAAEVLNNPDAAILSLNVNLRTTPKHITEDFSDLDKLLKRLKIRVQYNDITREQYNDEYKFQKVERLMLDGKELNRKR